MTNDMAFSVNAVTVGCIRRDRHVLDLHQSGFGEDGVHFPPSHVAVVGEKALRVLACELDDAGYGQASSREVMALREVANLAIDLLRATTPSKSDGICVHGLPWGRLSVALRQAGLTNQSDERVVAEVVS